MNSTGGDPSFLRRFNSSAVLRALHTHGSNHAFAEDDGLTVSQLAMIVSVSRPTAEEAAEALLAAGWIQALPPQMGDRRSAGRPDGKRHPRGRPAERHAIRRQPPVARAGR